MAEECTVVRFSRDPSSVRIESLKICDVPFKIAENNQHFGVFYVICIALSILTYVLDIALACMLLYYYSINGQGAYFAVTLTFVLVPALFMTTISLRWYIVDHDDPAIGKTSVFQWIIRMIFLLLQVAPLLRYIETLFYGVKSKVARSAGLDLLQQTNYFRRMLDEDTNGALLRLFHCFLHSAPQSIIQLMILLQHISNGKDINKNVAIFQAWTVLVALLSIAWALTSYHRSVRYARDDKDNISWVATLISFCWHLMSAVSRVLALSLLAAVYPAWMGIVCALHWGVMAIWLALEHLTSSCGNRCDELLLSIALGLAYVLAFISPKVGQTRYVYLAYYLVCFMENTAALVVWCVANNSLENPLLYYGAPSAQLIAFLLTITFLLIYYRFCHPSTSSSKKILEITDPSELDKPGFSKSYTHRSYS